MKGFARSLSRTVKLSHGSGDDKEIIELTLKPIPAGFANQLERQFPAPVQFVNGKEVAAPDSQKRPYQASFNLCILGWQLGSQVSTPWPGNEANPASFKAYAEDLTAELQEAGLNEGDIQQLFSESLALNNGIGDLLGKAN